MGSIVAPVGLDYKDVINAIQIALFYRSRNSHYGHVRQRNNLKRKKNPLAAQHAELLEGFVIFACITLCRRRVDVNVKIRRRARLAYTCMQ